LVYVLNENRYVVAKLYCRKGPDAAISRRIGITDEHEVTHKNISHIQAYVDRSSAV